MFSSLYLVIRWPKARPNPRRSHDVLGRSIQALYALVPFQNCPSNLATFMLHGKTLHVKTIRSASSPFLFATGNKAATVDYLHVLHAQHRITHDVKYVVRLFQE